MIKALGVGLAIANSALCFSQQETANIISEHVNSFQVDLSGGSLCSSYSCCNMSATESCGLSSMPKDQTTLVLPGGDTRCIYSYSTYVDRRFPINMTVVFYRPFAFQVIPGDSDKVLFYFQGMV